MTPHRPHTLPHYSSTSSTSSSSSSNSFHALTRTASIECEEEMRRYESPAMIEEEQIEEESEGEEEESGEEDEETFTPRRSTKVIDEVQSHRHSSSPHHTRHQHRHHSTKPLDPLAPHDYPPHSDDSAHGETDELPPLPPSFDTNATAAAAGVRSAWRSRSMPTSSSTSSSSIITHDTAPAGSPASHPSLNHSSISWTPGLPPPPPYVMVTPLTREEQERERERQQWYHAHPEDALMNADNDALPPAIPSHDGRLATMPSFVARAAGEAVPPAMRPMHEEAMMANVVNAPMPRRNTNMNRSDHRHGASSADESNSSSSSSSSSPQHPLIIDADADDLPPLPSMPHAAMTISNSRMQSLRSSTTLLSTSRPVQTTSEDDSDDEPIGDASSDELPPPTVHPLLVRQTGVYVATTSRPAV